MKFITVFLFGLVTVSGFCAEISYRNDFEKAEIGSVPDDFLVLEGQFEVKEEGGNKFLELPGAPVDTFGVLFGPNLKEDAQVSARIFGSSRGRRSFPFFEIGLNGVGGYKLRVSPAKKELEIYRGDSLKKSVPLEWESAKWTHLNLQLRKISESEWRVEGKIWQEGSEEPKEPVIVVIDKEMPPAGRASVGGSPISGTPIRYDDLVVAPAKK